MTARRMLATLVALCGLVIVAGCSSLVSSPSAPSNSNFAVAATIDHVDNGQITVFGTAVESGDSHAGALLAPIAFPDDTTYSSRTWVKNYHQVAPPSLFNASGARVTLAAVHPGQHVRISGHVESSGSGRLYVEYLVYDRLDILPE
jgi:hypothetical protein